MKNKFIRKLKTKKFMWSIFSIPHKKSAMKLGFVIHQPTRLKLNTLKLTLFQEILKSKRNRLTFSKYLFIINCLITIIILFSQLTILKNIYLMVPAKQHCQFSPFGLFINEVSGLDWHCCLAGSSKTAPRIFFNCHGCRLFLWGENHWDLGDRIFQA